MRFKNALTWLTMLTIWFAGFALECGAATDTIQYTYDDNLQVIRTDYSGTTVVDYVYDGAGNRLISTVSTNGIPANNPPSAPGSPSPANGAANLPATTALSWTGSDPDPGNQVVYDIYLGTTAAPALYQEGVSTTTFQPNRLFSLTTYYWKIKARDNYNNAAESPVWSFTTANEAPSTPVALAPLPNSTVAYGNAYLSWQSSDPDIGDTLTYDVYLGTSATPPLVSSNSVNSFYNLSNLTPNTTYYWQIIAKDNHGVSVTSPVWSFITASHLPVALNSGVTTNLTLTAAGGPYIIGSGFSVQAGATLTIQPGTIIKMQANTGLYIYGTLIAQGQSNNPIIITSANDDTYGGDTNGDGSATRPAKGDWNFIFFGNNADSSQLSYVKIFYGGNLGLGTIYCPNGGSTNIANCTIADSFSYGIFITSSSSAQITNSSFNGNVNYDVYIVSTYSGQVSGNTFQNGIYSNSTNSFPLTGNIFNYNNNFPIHLSADNIGGLLAANTFNNVTFSSYLEVTGGAITHDATWTALMPYHILSNITAQGTDGGDAVTTLTIQPGAKLLFNPGVSLIIGSSAPGALNAQGNAANPILFTSGKIPQAAGDWYGINFNSASAAYSILNYCIIQYAGTSYGALYISQCSPTIMNTVIHKSNSCGIYVQSGTPSIINDTFASNGNFDLYINSSSNVVVTGNTLQKGIYVGNGVLGNFSGNTITYNDGYPVRVNADDVGKLLANNTITNVTPNSFLEVTGGFINHNAVWTSLMPYHILGNITVQSASGLAILTIQPGARLLFNPGTYLTIGASSGAQGALDAQGTSANPILFTSGKDPQAAGDWQGIIFNPTTNSAVTILSYCTIEYAGYGTSGNAVTFSSASPSLSYCTIRYSQGYSIYVQAGSPTVTNNTFQNGLYVFNGALGSLTGNTITYNDSYPIRVSADDVGRLLANNTITNVTANSFLNVTGGTVSHDAAWTTLMPYHILGGIIVQGTSGLATLTIQPGARLLFNQYTQLTIGASSGAQGALNAQGTSANPILFTSGKSPQAAGDWQGITFNPTTNSAATVLSYCTVEYGGTGTSGSAVNINSVSPALSYCTIRYSQGYGICIQSGSPQITYCTISNCGWYGIYVGSGSPSITNNTFANNANFDLYIISGTNITLNANTIQKGLYVQSGVLGSLSGNIITYNDGYPIRVNADDVGRLLANNTITNVTANSFLNVTGGTVSHDAAWTALMPYHILGSITVQGTDGGDALTTLTIQPGAILFFNQYTGFTIGASSGAPGALNAQASSGNPILFTSGKTPQAAGDWYGITFNPTTNSGMTILNYCIIQYAGGSGQGALYISQCSPTISHCTVRYNQGDGIYISGSPQISYNTISNCGRYGLNIQSGTPNITNNTFASNGNFDLYIGIGTNVVVTGNTIQKGLYVGSGILGSLSSNAITYNDSYPIRLSADNVGKLLANNTITNVTANSYLEVTTGTISHDAAWTALMPYHILGSITVQGTDGGDALTTLTIQPGAKLMFNQYTSLAIGAYSGAPGALNAQGTSSNRILFTSGKTTPAAGDWYAIFFYSTTNSAATILNYCTVQYAGGSGQGALYIYQCSPTIQNTIISNSSSYGAYIYGGSPVFQNCQFSANANYDLYYSGSVGGSVSGCTINSGIYFVNNASVNFSGNTINYNNNRPVRLSADNVGSFISSSVIANITPDSYLEVVGGIISHDAAWTALMPYHILGTITVQGTDGADSLTTLTIQPGAKLLFNPYTQLIIGANSGAPGALNAQASSANPILFTSGKTPQAAGDWYGIYFYNTTNDAATILDYCLVQYAGGVNYGALYIDQASPTMKNTTVNNSSTCGVYIYNSSPIIQNSLFNANANYDLYYNGTVGGSIQGCTVNKGISLLATSTVYFSGTTVNYNNAFPVKLYADNVGTVLSGTTLFNINSNSYLAVSGGTISHDAAWTSVIPYYITAGILVQGKDGADNITTLTIQPGALLLFNQYTSLTVGNTSGDPGALIAQGTAENPVWFTSGKTTPAAGDWYGIRFYNTSNDATAIMEYCNVEYGGYNNQGGIYIWDASPTLQYNTITNNKYGIYVYSGNPVIVNNDIFNNSVYGLYKSSAPLLDAVYNWWGDATGPYHPTANPGGTGNAVSNYVNFSPWLTE